MSLLAFQTGVPPLAAAAQSGATRDFWSFVGRIVPWVILLVVAVVVLAVVYRWARRLLTDEESARAFSLSDLRRMRDEGTLTAEEFERAKATVVARELQALREGEEGEEEE